MRTRRRKVIAVGLGGLALAFGAVSWVNRSSTVTGEIRDTAIVLSADHAGAIVNLELRNAGREPCDLIVVLTSLAVDALPAESGRVVVYDGNAVEMGPNGKAPQVCRCSVTRTRSTESRPRSDRLSIQETSPASRSRSTLPREQTTG